MYNVYTNIKYLVYIYSGLMSIISLTVIAHFEYSAHHDELQW